LNRLQLEHLIRAASAIADDPEIIVIGSQAILGPVANPPAIAMMSMEADLYPRNHPERAELVDGAIGELSVFHDQFGYYAQGVSPDTAILPSGWQDRLVIVKNANTGSGTGLCLSIPDLMLSKYAAGREKDRAFNHALAAHGLADLATLRQLLATLPVDETRRCTIATQMAQDFGAAPAG
jgi:hypothetical protein